MAVATKARPKAAIIAAPEPTRKEIVLPELERIRLENGGILKAEAVVAEAESEDSPLHPYFQWDDNAAASEYRLWQARQLITAMVIVLPMYRRPITAYVSLRSDRTLVAGGYRAMVEVLADPVLRNDLLCEALDDIKVWEMKYRRLTELSEIFHAIASVTKKHPKKKKA